MTVSCLFHLNTTPSSLLLPTFVAVIFQEEIEQTFTLFSLVMYILHPVTGCFQPQYSYFSRVVVLSFTSPH